MTGYKSKRAAAQDKLDDDDTLTIAYQSGYYDGKKAAQPAQKPVAYDKTEMNGFVQDLYDKKMQEGKHGHYETMFHVVHQAIKKAAQPAQEPVATLFGTLPVYDNTPPQRPWVDLTDEEIKCIEETTTCSGNESWLRNLTRSLEAKLKEKNA